MKLYVLTYADKAVSASERRERLDEEMTRYTAAQQIHMHIDVVEVLT